MAPRSLSMLTSPTGRAIGSVPCDQSVGRSELEQLLLQRLSSAMEPTHDGSDRDIEDFGDLLVRETLDVGEQHGQPELLGQRLDGAFDLVVGEPIEQFVLGAAPGVGGFETAEA